MLICIIWIDIVLVFRCIIIVSLFILFSTAHITGTNRVFRIRFTIHVLKLFALPAFCLSMFIVSSISMIMPHSIPLPCICLVCGVEINVNVEIIDPSHTTMICLTTIFSSSLSNHLPGDIILVDSVAVFS